MDVREKLVELLMEFIEVDAWGNGEFIEKSIDFQKIASDLIAHGVTVQECVLPEQDYYVLRNTETGMYFRGKGANRWGKHFNQATICRVKGTAEHNIKDLAWHGEKAELVRIKIVEVPRPKKGEWLCQSVRV